MVGWCSRLIFSGVCASIDDPKRRKKQHQKPGMYCIVTREKKSFHFFVRFFEFCRCRRTAQIHHHPSIHPFIWLEKANVGTRTLTNQTYIGIPVIWFHFIFGQSFYFCSKRNFFNRPITIKKFHEKTSWFIVVGLFGHICFVFGCWFSSLNDVSEWMNHHQNFNSFGKQFTFLVNLWSSSSSCPTFVFDFQS